MASMKEMADTLIKRINDLATPVKIMHVCGSHEHTIMEHGIRSLLVLFLQEKLMNVYN